MIPYYAYFIIVDMHFSQIEWISRMACNISKAKQDFTNQKMNILCKICCHFFRYCNALILGAFQIVFGLKIGWNWMESCIDGVMCLSRVKDNFGKAPSSDKNWHFSYLTLFTIGEHVNQIRVNVCSQCYL